MPGREDRGAGLHTREAACLKTWPSTCLHVVAPEKAGGRARAGPRMFLEDPPRHPDPRSDSFPPFFSPLVVSPSRGETGDALKKGTGMASDSRALESPLVRVSPPDHGAYRKLLSMQRAAHLRAGPEGMLPRPLLTGAFRVPQAHGQGPKVCPRRRGRRAGGPGGRREQRGREQQQRGGPTGDRSRGGPAPGRRDRGAATAEAQGAPVQRPLVRVILNNCVCSSL